MNKEGDSFKEHQEEDDIVQSHLEQMDKKKRERREEEGKGKPKILLETALSSKKNKNL
jgi:hypothetical protein